MVVDYVNKIGFEQAARVFNRDKQTIVMWLKTGSIPMSAAQIVMDHPLDDSVGQPPIEQDVKFDGGLFHPPKKEPVLVPEPAPVMVAETLPAAKSEPLTPPLSVWGKDIEARLEKLEQFARLMTDPDRKRPSLAQPPTQAIATQAVPHPLMEPVIEGGAPARMDEEVIELPNSNREWNTPYKEYREDGRRSVSR